MLCQPQRSAGVGALPKSQAFEKNTASVVWPSKLWKRPWSLLQDLFFLLSGYIYIFLVVTLDL